MRKKKVVGCAVLWLFIFMISPAYINAQTEVFSDVPAEDPKIIIATDRWMQVFQAGTQDTLSIPIKNVGGTALNAVVSLAVSDPKSIPFETDKMSFTKYMSSFSGETLYSQKITIPPNVEAGIYPLTLNVSYDSQAGGGGSQSATVYIKITSDLQPPQLKLMRVEMADEALKAGKSEVVKLFLRNDSDLPMNTVTLRLSGFTADGINLDDWPDTQSISLIKAGEMRPVEYKLSAGPKMESGTYALDLAMQYQDEQHHKYTQEQKVYLPVAGKGEQDDLIPRILLDNYYLGSDHVLAGETFPLTLVFRNTSTNKAVHNVKVSLSSEADIFAPVSGSNSLYFPRIDPDQSLEQTLHLNARPNAEHKVYTLTAKLDYQDDDGNKLEEQEMISLPVVKEVKLTTSEVEVPPDAFMGNPIGISLELFNTGRGLIRNLMIRTEGDFEVQNGTLFIGNLEAGKDDYYDSTLIAQKEGPLKGKVVLSYEDELGQPFQVEKNFTLTVQAMPPEPPPGPNMPGAETGEGKVKPWMIIVGSVILLMALGTVIWIRRRKRRRLEEVDLDE